MQSTKTKGQLKLHTSLLTIKRQGTYLLTAFDI